MIDHLIEKLIELKKQSSNDNPLVYVQVNNEDSSDFYELIENELTFKIDVDGWIGIVLDNGGGID